jgi:hypothetical protein
MHTSTEAKMSSVSPWSLTMRIYTHLVSVCSIAVEWAFPSEDWLLTLFPSVNYKLVSLPWHTPDHWKISTSAVCNAMVRRWGDRRYATVSIKQAIFKCGIAQFSRPPHNFLFTAHFRTIYRSSHISAQFTIIRNVLQNFMHKNPLYYFHS